MFERRDRNTNGGGVFIGICDSLVSVNHPELRRDSCEPLWQHLEFEKSGKLYLSSFYRPPSAGVMGRDFGGIIDEQHKMF